MRIVAMVVSFLGLVLTVVPAFLVFGGVVSWGTHATAMLVGVLLWFGSAPVWLGSRSGESSP
jgi:hypothetical protein